MRMSSSVTARGIARGAGAASAVAPAGVDAGAAGVAAVFALSGRAERGESAPGFLRPGPAGVSVLGATESGSAISMVTGGCAGPWTAALRSREAPLVVDGVGLVERGSDGAVGVFFG